jgi:hypothetical protein
MRVYSLVFNKLEFLVKGSIVRLIRCGAHYADKIKAHYYEREISYCAKVDYTWRRLCARMTQNDELRACFNSCYSALASS